MTRYAVKVRYVQERTIMVDAITPKQAAEKAEEVARGFTNVVAAQAVVAREATPETLRQSRQKPPT